MFGVGFCAANPPNPSGQPYPPMLTLHGGFMYWLVRTARKGIRGKSGIDRDCGASFVSEKA